MAVVINDWVYHATPKGNADKILKQGFYVKKHGVANIYGRGIYFWELKEDAVLYGESNFPKGHDIVKSKFSVTKNNSIIWNSIYRNQSPDTIANNLIRKGIKVVIIPNRLIEETTFGKAKGDALCYLVDL